MLSISEPYGFSNIDTSSPTPAPQYIDLVKKNTTVIIAATVVSVAVVLMMVVGILYRRYLNQAKMAKFETQNIYGARHSDLITRSNPLSTNRRLSATNVDVDYFFSSPHTSNTSNNSNTSSSETKQGQRVSITNTAHLVNSKRKSGSGLENYKARRSINNNTRTLQESQISQSDVEPGTSRFSWLRQKNNDDDDSPRISVRRSVVQDDSTPTTFRANPMDSRRRPSVISNTRSSIRRNSAVVQNLRLALKLLLLLLILYYYYYYYYDYY